MGISIINNEDACFWVGRNDTFQKATAHEILTILKSSHRKYCNENASDSQITAWANSISILKDSLSRLPQNIGVIFEYVLPRERGRRPDVILLIHPYVLVLEFKDHAKVRAAHVDQIASYGRDLAEYQSFCRNKPVIPLLVLTKGGMLNQDRNGLLILSPDTLTKIILEHVQSGSGENAQIEEFLRADYSPLPSIVSAAKMLFEKEPLPYIRRADSAGIPDALKFLHKIADDAINSGNKLLILVTGVPGSGKTLLGLQFVYDRSDYQTNQAVFLSGNGPLVEVLRYTLQTNVFVQDVHGFLRQYGGASKRIPNEAIWIYDEAQRAWDDIRAQEKRGENALSEPKDFVRLGERKNGGTVILGLIGEGQEIHIGEEAGIRQWNQAIQSGSQKWMVACPDAIASVFKNSYKCITDQRLNLTQSLRTHRASDLQNWVNLILDSRLEDAQKLMNNLIRDFYPIYLTRSRSSAVTHVQEKYLGFEEKRFGILASSKAKNLQKHQIPNDYLSTKVMKIGPWYSDDPSSPLSCCQFDRVATEFSCQGLELDFPIVAWGDDLIWDSSMARWVSVNGKSKANDPHRLRINSYRVLLTRGRDGMVIFVPDDLIMDSTANALILAGCQEF